MSIVSLKNESKRMLVEEYKQVKQLLKEAEAKEKELRERLISEIGEFMDYGVCCKRVERAGSIDYKAIVVSEGLSEDYVESFRKPVSTFYKISAY